MALGKPPERTLHTHASPLTGGRAFTDIPNFLSPQEVEAAFGSASLEQVRSSMNTGTVSRRISPSMCGPLPEVHDHLCLAAIERPLSCLGGGAWRPRMGAPSAN